MCDPDSAIVSDEVVALASQLAAELAADVWLAGYRQGVVDGEVRLEESYARAWAEVRAMVLRHASMPDHAESVLRQTADRPDSRPAAGELAGWVRSGR